MTTTLSPTTTTSALGGVVRRKEDPALIQGRGTYTDDIKRQGELAASFARSPFAHATITSIDITAAKAMPGVHAVYTIDDVRQLGPLLAQVPVGALRPLLADGMVKHVGEAVAMVVADNRYLAQDAADAIVVDYEPHDAVIDLKEALSDAVKVHDSLDSNVLVSWVGPFGAEAEAQEQVKADIDAAKEREDTVTVSQEMWNQRLIPVPIEPASRRRRVQQGLLGVDRVQLLADPARPRRGVGQDPRVAVQPGAGDRPRGGRGLRLQAQHLRRGGPHRPRRDAGQPPGEVDRGPPGELRRHHPRAGAGGLRRPGAGQRGAHRGPALQDHRRPGGLRPGQHRGHPHPLQPRPLRLLRHPRPLQRADRRLHHPAPHGRLPGGRAPRGGAPGGAGGGRRGAGGRDRPRRVPAQELRPQGEVPLPLQGRGGVRLGGLRAGPRPGPGDRRLRRAAGGAAPGQRRSAGAEAAGDRPLQLHRAVRV